MPHTCWHPRSNIVTLQCCVSQTLSPSSRAPAERLVPGEPSPYNALAADSSWADTSMVHQPLRVLSSNVRGATRFTIKRLQADMVYCYSCCVTLLWTMTIRRSENVSRILQVSVPRWILCSSEVTQRRIDPHTDQDWFNSFTSRSFQTLRTSLCAGCRSGALWRLFVWAVVSLPLTTLLRLLWSSCTILLEAFLSGMPTSPWNRHS